MQLSESVNADFQRMQLIRLINNYSVAEGVLLLGQLADDLILDLRMRVA